MKVLYLSLALLATLGTLTLAEYAPRPFIYGCGITWGNWLGLPLTQAEAFDDLSMDYIKAMGATCVPANFCWLDIEPKPGEYHWEYVDHQVEAARKRGLEIFAYTGLTPDWALPAEAPDKPGIGYRFPPDEKFAPRFEAFFTTLARRYRGKVKYYEFWNEENGCGWIKPNCGNADMAKTYVPWLKRWYQAMKRGDPDCVLALGGLDYNEGVKEGWKYLEDVYKYGGGPYFDAVAIHPYGKPLHWQAILDTYKVLVRHGDAHKKLWINEYGWATKDEDLKAKWLAEVLKELAKPKYHMVFEANYLVLTDLPGSNDNTGHDFGLCSRNRKALTITPRKSYEAFKALPKLWSKADLERWEAQPKSKDARGEVPEGFLLGLTAPGCNPGSNCDDVGPPWKVREAAIRKTGVNWGNITIAWRTTEPIPPNSSGHHYTFDKLEFPKRELERRHLVVHLDFFGNPWAERFRFKDRKRYNELLAEWAHAACAYARKRFGATLFATGGNERDLVAKQTYQPYFPDWHYYYMDPIKAVHRGMKAANPDNKLIIGNLCYSDRSHIGALYDAGAKGNFEILAIHAYGKTGAYVDMEQVLESHEEMAAHGDADIPILLTEGWSSFPLPASIDKDQRWRKGPRPYTPQEIEHYRQCVLDGWRNLTTARPGFFDPKWVLGASYFVLDDHWGGRNWAKRAKPKYDAKGNLLGFLLDGYFIGTHDPDYIKPFLRPWGLMDIEGKPKGDILEAFPPQLPACNFMAILHADLQVKGYDPHHPANTCPVVQAGRPYRVSVEFTNLEQAPFTQMHFRLGEHSDADYPGGYDFVYEDGVLDVFTDTSPDAHKVKAKLLDYAPGVAWPGKTLSLEYEITFSPELAKPLGNGVKQRVRPLVDLYFVWGDRPYHVDAWLPRVQVVLPPGT